MAKEKKSNASSSSNSSRSATKDSVPSPNSTSINESKESVSPEKAPSNNKSESPPPPSQPPPSPPPQPSPSNSSPPSSPPPTPPPPSKSPAPPPRTSPPPSKNLPPSPQTPSPPPPPTTTTTTTLPPSPPPPSSSSSSSSSPPPPSPPSPPPPSSSQSPNTNSPPSSESPPPSPETSTPPSPDSYTSPPPAQTFVPPLQSPPVSPGSEAKPLAPSSKTSGPSTSPPSNNINPNTRQYIGFGFAAFFFVAFMVVVLLMVLKKKDKRGIVYGTIPPPKKSPMKGDVHFCVEDPGFGSGSQEVFYSTRNHAGSAQHSGTPPDSAAQQPVNAGQIVFSYDKIVEITDGFSGNNVIGEGGFGRVYKASMPDGRVGAVKLLKAGSGQGEREFKAEVEIISRIHHRHLVSLIGYCISEQQRVLIYEFVPNGNLDQHLHEREKMVLDWPKRMKIAIGASRGLAYLHEGCNPKIIHRDIKSANILLDDAYEAQVADFGLARLTSEVNTHVSTRVMGTFGYMAPEYATSGKLTDRSDVFSFGVVLLELVTGRKPVDPDQPVGDESLVEWARPHLLHAIGTHDFSKLVDPRLEQYVDAEMFRMIEAAAACIRHSALKRPSMVQIARALDSGDQLCDLSNGVKYGQSTVYDSGQYNEEIRRFNGRDNISSFGDSEFDIYSREYNSRDMSEPIRITTQSSSGDSEIRIFDGQRSNADSRL